MVRWQSELRVSRWAQWLTLLWHGVASLALLLAPWPAHLRQVCVVLLLAVVAESGFSLWRIHRRCGGISLLAGDQLCWHNQRWDCVGRPWMGQQLILLRLRTASGKRENLWLMRDSLSTRHWRRLRLQLLNPPAGERATADRPVQ
ncbi:hypothetical protein BL250_16830 [Erwinia sp. OLTSP20]|uniref:protein YgfX n=1 Tax=unclassified Erwinia TaxID=2622719 RepID=UPI000C1A4214|nr:MULTISPECIES: protein YgfX [unclassified Erwinia]PIJ48996.1 hypothetical protein BV501_14905 [Erwinia sp. OAMSP11]PIJ74989.1 hypothetical protein BK416_02525 [Erwinia sp. OLSSP12]PIJ79680.1 hypothetical protein BLD47_13530 [Erwinia sp. OLCASP19]PIJ80465.1 hypothetical protein BLD46_15375 [Erwinia sp. OLMTSP26]PIJ82580.1 hypothetical protein BLD49_15270 [Erwinia sp. OLMDSP33]